MIFDMEANPTEPTERMKKALWTIMKLPATKIRLTPIVTVDYQGDAMARLTRKRQVTLPKAVCNAIGFQAGDFVDVFAHDGMIHVVKVDSDNLAAKSNDSIKCKDLPTIDDIKNSQ